MVGQIDDCRSTCKVVFLYVYGMLSAILGIGSSIASIDPRPFPISLWLYFLVGGISLVINGCVALALIPLVAPFQVAKRANETTCSAADLLEESQYNPTLEMKDAAFGFDECSASTASCQSLSTESSTVSTTNPSIFYYKETFV
ncbi:hypothetical protein CDAR_300901 [Caerostris darwini]|uniref:Uncharacterized protein n=1 Tax=Caerostris darwini TaxID=1538125 RepID=A0AAV4WDU1_9ARAC|nr:hypothetical protein CDAR_300901 [Caerostris darwini]